MFLYWDTQGLVFFAETGRLINQRLDLLLPFGAVAGAASWPPYRGVKVRQAALVFYSQVQQERYATGRSHRLPEAEPMAIIEASSQETQGVCDTSSPANQSPLGFG